MVRLDHEDLAGVLALVRAVGDAEDPDDFLSETLTGVRRLVPCDVVTVNEVVPYRERVVYWMEPETFPIPPEAPGRLAALAGEHPVISHMSATGDGSARRISDFWSQPEFHASRLYELVYKPMGVEYQMAVGLPIPRPAVLGLVTNRAERDFSERDRLVMNTARPYLAQHWRGAQDQQRLRALISTAAEVLSERGSGVVVLWDPPQELTAGALITLYRYFGRPSMSSVLPTRVQRWVDAQRTRPPDLALDRPLTARTAERRVVVRYVPAKRTHPDAILIEEGEKIGSRPSLESLGLTARESDVARLVITGATNARIADQLQVSATTVKKHLDNIYRRLGVSSRGQLTALIVGTTAP